MGLVTTSLTAMESSTGIAMPGTLALVLSGLHHPHTAPLESLALVILEVNSILEMVSNAQPNVAQQVTWFYYSLESMSSGVYLAPHASPESIPFDVPGGFVYL